MTNPDEHEMAVYLLGGDLRPGLYPVASSFGDFVIEYLLKGRYGRECHPNYENDLDAWATGKPINFYHIPSDDPPKPRKRKKK